MPHHQPNNAYAHYHDRDNMNTTNNEHVHDHTLQTGR